MNWEGHTHFSAPSDNQLILLYYLLNISTPHPNSASHWNRCTQWNQMHCLMSQCMAHYSWSLASHFAFWNARHFVMNIFKNKIHNQIWILIHTNNGSIFNHSSQSICILKALFRFLTAKKKKKKAYFNTKNFYPYPHVSHTNSQCCREGTRSKLHLPSSQPDLLIFPRRFWHKHFLLSKEIFLAPTTW